MMGTGDLVEGLRLEVRGNHGWNWGLCGMLDRGLRDEVEVELGLCFFKIHCNILISFYTVISYITHLHVFKCGQSLDKLTLGLQ